jgi:predicted dehydrogenase
VRVAIVGFGGRGQDHIKGFMGQPGVRITALCDIDEEILAKGVAQLKKAKNWECEAYRDIRDLLASKNVDVVSIATTNHWHALASIWSIQAGKDVYVEKPVSHNVFEGRKIIEAARKHGRIVQSGTQSRSSRGLHEALAWTNAGHFGKLLWARGTCYKRRKTINKVTEDQPVPPGVDYDLWLGPAPQKPIRRKRFHYDWHWQWDYGNGDLGNQGIHQMDIARWFMGETDLSPAVMAVGGRVGYVDDGETPNTLIVSHLYPKAPLYFEVRGLPEKVGTENMDSYRGAGVGVILQYEKGHILIPNYIHAGAFDQSGAFLQGWGGFRGPKKGNTAATAASAAQKPTPTEDGAETAPDAGSKTARAESHYENFIKAVRNRKSATLHADIHEGHISSGLCHTANISYRLGKPAVPEAVRDALNGDKLAGEAFGRMLEHLKLNEVDVAKEKLTLGPLLKFDPKTERFVDNPEADRHLTREYRKPFTVPDHV